MYHRVVVPLDGSDLAECSVDDVKDVIDASGEFVLLRVLEPATSPVLAELPADVLRNIEQKNAAGARAYLAKVAGKLEKRGYKVRTDLRYGNPADEIIECARKTRADLIAISTHGRSGVSRWAFGSVADKVLRTARLPVLIVTPKGCHLNT